jgi:hypothetical protein
MPAPADVPPPAEEPLPVAPAEPEPAADAPPPAEPPAPAEELAPPDDDPFSMNDSLYRTWTDDTGRHQIVARFVTTLDGGVVRLQKPNGRFVRVAFGRLSLVDQTFVRSQSDVLVMK